MLIEELTMPEFEEGLTRTQSVYIPVGSVEEHGIHLPLSTDTLQAYEVGKKAALQIPLFVSPAIAYGNCRSSSCHPGTISIRTETLKMLLTDIVTSLRSQGLRNFVVLTGHAGNAHRLALLDAGEALMERFFDIKMAVVTEYDLALAEGRAIIETLRDSHAGEIETSRILYSHPHLVKGTSPEEYPTFPPGILVRNKRNYWPGGVWGNPAMATADKGRRLEELVVAKVVELVRALESFEE